MNEKKDQKYQNLLGFINADKLNISSMLVFGCCSCSKECNDAYNFK